MAKTIFTENFDGLTDGDLNGQNNWVANTNIDVQTSVVRAGAKAISFPNNCNGLAVQTFNGISIGSISISVRSTVTNGRGGYVWLYSGATAVGVIRLDSTGYIKFYTAATNIDVIAYSANTWYDLVFEFNCSNNTYRFSVDGGATFTDWVALYQSSSVDTIDSIKIGSGTASSSGTGYFDSLIISSTDIKLINEIPVYSIKLINDIPENTIKKINGLDMHY